MSFNSLGLRPSSPPQKSRMSLTQTYRVASTARGKLGMEASRADHNLRRLVGHANLLDGLMLELANAEREQEAWFNDAIRSSNKGETAKHIQWFDSIVEEEEAFEDDSESDSDSELDADDYVFPTRRRSASPPPSSSVYVDEEEVESYDDDEDLTLTRVSSHSTPELVHEDSESDDESMPPSPSHTAIDFDTKTGAAVSQTELFPKTTISQFNPDVVAEDFIRQSPAMVQAY